MLSMWNSIWWNFPFFIAYQSICAILSFAFLSPALFRSFLMSVHKTNTKRRRTRCVFVYVSFLWHTERVCSRSGASRRRVCADVPIQQTANNRMDTAHLSLSSTIKENKKKNKQNNKKMYIHRKTREECEKCMCHNQNCLAFECFPSRTRAVCVVTVWCDICLDATYFGFV